MSSSADRHKHYPIHIRNLITELKSGGDIISILSSYIPLLTSDMSLYYIFIQYNYSPEHGNFLSPPNSSDLITSIEKEYHSSLPDIEELCSKLVIDVKKVFLSSFISQDLQLLSDPSELDLVESTQTMTPEDFESQPATHSKFNLNSDMNTPRVNKGLKVLSKKIKDILIQKGKISYKEMADIVVTDMEKEIERDKEERNVLRRIYDGLNVLEACGVVGKSDKKYYWKGYSKPHSEVKDNLSVKVNETKSNVQVKREILRDYCKRYYSVNELISRNKASVKPEDKIEFPFIIVGTEEHHSNKVKIESNKSLTNISIKFQKEAKLFGDSDILIHLGLHSRPMHSHDIPVDLFDSLACKPITRLFN